MRRRAGKPSLSAPRSSVRVEQLPQRGYRDRNDDHAAARHGPIIGPGQPSRSGRPATVHHGAPPLTGAKITNSGRTAAPSTATAAHDDHAAAHPPARSRRSLNAPLAAGPPSYRPHCPISITVRGRAAAPYAATAPQAMTTPPFVRPARPPHGEPRRSRSITAAARSSRVPPRAAPRCRSTGRRRGRGPGRRPEPVGPVRGARAHHAGRRCGIAPAPR
jgi:hypothetical protein